jgi:hypothetical protein
MALVANDPADFVDQLILLTRRLADLAERQAALFEAARYGDASSLTDEAGRLAAVYALESRRVAQAPDVVNAAPPALRAVLKAETERFRAAMGAHERAIDRQRILAEGLVRAIAEETVAARPVAGTYGPGAIIQRDASAVALDKRA